MKLFRIVFLLLITSNILFSQATELTQLNSQSTEYQLLTQTDNLILFHERISAEAYNIWLTDGTSLGTKELNLITHSFRDLAYAIDDTIVFGVYAKEYDQNITFYMLTEQDKTPKEIFKTYGSFHKIKSQGESIILYSSKTYRVNKKTFAITEVVYPYHDPIFWNGYNFNIYKDTLFKYHNFSSRVALMNIPEIQKIIPLSDSSLLIVSKHAIWKSDGSTENTKILKEFSNDVDIWRSKILETNGKLVLLVRSSDIEELWSFDGTEIGSKLLHSFNTHVINGIINTRMYKINDKVYIFFDNQIWETQGTTNSTKIAFHNPYGSIISSNIVSTEVGLLISHPNQLGFWQYSFFYTDSYELFPIQSDDGLFFKQVAYWYSGEKMVSGDYIYLSLLDVPFGNEMHRFNYQTKKMELVNDAAVGTAWSSPSFIATLHHKSLFVSNTMRTPTLYIVDNQSNIPSIEIPKKNYNWAQSISPTNLDWHNSLSYDDIYLGTNNQTVISLRTHQDTLTILQKGMTPIKTRPKEDCVVLLDSSGQYLWHQSFKSNANQYPVAIDSEGNILLGLTIQDDTITIDHNTILKRDGQLFIGKLSSLGHLIWFKQFKVGGSNAISDIEITKNNEIIIAGKYYNDEVLFGDVKLIKKRIFSMYLVKLNSEGDVIWAKDLPFPSYWPAKMIVKKITIDDTNHKIYMLRNSTDIILSENCPSQADMINLTQLNLSDGQIQWTKNIKGTSHAIASDITVSNQGNTTIVGTYRDQISIDNFTNDGDCDSYSPLFIQFNAQGKVIQTHNYKITYPDVKGIVTDDKQNLYILSGDSRWHRPTLLGFESNPGYFRHKYVVQKFKPDGRLIENRNIHGGVTPYHNYPVTPAQTRLSMRDNKMIFSTNFNRMLDTFNLTYSINRVFSKVGLIQFELDKQLFSQDVDNQLNTHNLHLAPNPSNDYFIITSSDLDFVGARVRIFSINGEEIKSIHSVVSEFGTIQVDVRHLPQGIYIANIQTKNLSSSKKFVKF